MPQSYKVPEFLEGLQAIMTDAGTVSLECKVHHSLLIAPLVIVIYTFLTLNMIWIGDRDAHTKTNMVERRS